MSSGSEVSATFDPSALAALDALVDAGLVRDRVGALRMTVANLRDRLAADREETLRSLLHDPDMQALAEWGSRHPVPLED